MDYLFSEDIRHHIIRHLPYVDRRELSRVCKAFQEPYAKSFHKYVELGLNIMGIDIKDYLHGYICGEFVLWVTIELTLAGDYSWKAEGVRVFIKGDEPSHTISWDVDIIVTNIHPIRHIDCCAHTNIYKLIYHAKLGLFVKNWGVIQARRARVVPNFLTLILRYEHMGDEERSECLRDFMIFNAKQHQKHCGLTLVPYENISRLRECFEPILRAASCDDIYKKTSAVVTATMINSGYTLAPFLEEDTN